MAQEYFAIITDIGANKLLNQKLDITHFAVGNALEDYKPTSDMTQLKNEKWRGIVTRVDVPEGMPNELIIETYIPATIGGFGVNEMAAFDVDGDMIAIAITPIISKPTPESGSGIDLTPRIRLILASTENFIIKIDSTDKDYVDAAIGQHNTDPEAHPDIREELTKPPIVVDLPLLNGFLAESYAKIRSYSDGKVSLNLMLGHQDGILNAGTYIVGKIPKGLYSSKEASLGLARSTDNIVFSLWITHLGEVKLYVSTDLQSSSLPILVTAEINKEGVLVVLGVLIGKDKAPIDLVLMEGKDGNYLVDFELGEGDFVLIKDGAEDVFSGKWVKPVLVGHKVKDNITTTGIWTETATPEEIEAAKPEPLPPPAPTPTELALAELSILFAQQQAENQQLQQAVAELSMVVAQGGM